MLVPATILTTPVLSILTILGVDVFAVVPRPLANVIVGLAHANSVLKLVTVLLNAVYSESLFADSLGNPTLITCCPEIAMI